MLLKLFCSAMFLFFSLVNFVHAQYQTKPVKFYRTKKATKPQENLPQESQKEPSKSHSQLDEQSRYSEKKKLESIFSAEESFGHKSIKELRQIASELYGIPVDSMSNSAVEARDDYLAAIQQAKDYSKTSIKKLFLSNSWRNNSKGGVDEYGALFVNPHKDNYTDFLISQTGPHVKSAIKSIPMLEQIASELYGIPVKSLSNSAVKKRDDYLAAIQHAKDYSKTSIKRLIILQRPSANDSKGGIDADGTLFANPHKDNYINFLDSQSEVNL